MASEQRGETACATIAKQQTLQSDLLLNYFLNNWPLFPAVAILLVVFGCRLVDFCRWLGNRRSERRHARNFAKFEADLVDSDSASNNSPFLTGESKLPTDVTIHLPNYTDEDSLLQSVTQGLALHSLGAVTRHFRIGNDFGMDVHLNDFVDGVEYLRNCLLEHNAPTGTIIEYDGGDLDIHS